MEQHHAKPIIAQRTTLDYYRQLVADTHPRGGITVNGLELDHEQMAVILQIHDYGLHGISDEEKAVLYRLIGDLKTRIHP